MGCFEINGFNPVMYQIVVVRDRETLFCSMIAVLVYFKVLFYFWGVFCCFFMPPVSVLFCAHVICVANFFLFS